jgi:probable phosphoglycerate mutase
MTVLTLVRHGETDWNRARRIQGLTDIPLNDTGREQAKDAAAGLRRALDPSLPVAVAASDLVRARETAEIIAESLGAPEPLLYRDLRERGYGQAEGVDIAEFDRRWGPWHSAEVPGAESRDRLRRRALRGLRLAVADARASGSAYPPSLVIVSHGALIREVIHHASGGMLPLDGERLPNGSAHRLLWERERVRLLSYTAAGID